MQIARFHTFVAESRNDFLSRGNVQAVSYYYVFNRSWYGEASEEIKDASLTKLLERTQSDQLPFHSPRSQDAYFPVPELMAVVRITFQASPSKKTRDALAVSIKKNLEHAENAFKVSHNQLTGLWARDAFIKNIEDALSSLYSAPLAGETGSPDIDAAKALCVYALDIDHFKQINDSYGHLYGDLVLKAFAVRLARLARQFQEQYSPKLKIEVAHFSGEEFFALATGNVPTKVFRDFAEIMRSQISEHSLPSDEEFDLFASQFGSPLITGAPRSARNVAASIGVSLSGDIRTPKDPRSVATILLDQADIALYKSKGSGRNRVTMFSEILERSGRVLEHRPENDVIVIDIGSKVNVSRGQEFRVFHPDFGGASPFLVDDGRTKRVLGTYPKIECGRIVVFDVQKEVAFCRLVSTGSNRNIPIAIGSNLEAIPVGAIGHIIAPTNPNALFPGEAIDIATPERVSAEIRRAASGKEDFVVACFRIQNDKDILEKHGSVFVNRALAQLYLTIKESVSPRDIIGQLDPIMLVIVTDTKGSAEEFKEWITEVIMKASKPFNEAVEFVVGAYLPNERDYLQKSKALEMARYAVSEEGLPSGEAVEIFTDRTAERILGAWRERRDASKGLVDYRQLKECGVRSGQFENYAGLLASSTGDLALAVACYREAARLSPQNTTFKLNIASAEYKLGNWKGSLGAIRQVGAQAIRARAWPWFRVVYALTLYCEFKNNPSQSNMDELKLAVSEAIEAYDEKDTSHYKALEQASLELELL